MEYDSPIFSFLAFTNIIHLILVIGVGFALKKKALRKWRLGSIFATVNAVGCVGSTLVFPLVYNQIVHDVSHYNSYIYLPMILFPGTWSYLLDGAGGFHDMIFRLLPWQHLDSYFFFRYALGPVMFGLTVETPILLWLGRVITNWKNDGATDHCHVCEHDFKGLGAITECPECGTPLGDDVIEGRDYDRTRAGRHHR